MIAMEEALSVSGWHYVVARWARPLWRLIPRPWTLARSHNLNPWAFVLMAALGHTVQALVFLPWFRSDASQLVLLIALRLIACVIPLYIWVKGRRIAAAFSASVTGMFVFNTAWQVCYYVYA